MNNRLRMWTTFFAAANLPLSQHWLERNTVFVTMRDNTFEQWCYFMAHRHNLTFRLGQGQYSHFRYTIDTEINRYVSIRRSSCCTVTSRRIISYLTFIQLRKRLRHIEYEFDLNYVEIILNKTTVHTTQVITLL